MSNSSSDTGAIDAMLMDVALRLMENWHQHKDTLLKQFENFDDYVSEYARTVRAVRAQLTKGDEDDPDDNWGLW